MVAGILPGGMERSGRSWGFGLVSTGRLITFASVRVLSQGGHQSSEGIGREHSGMGAKRRKRGGASRESKA